jgi:hypothetical protein
MCCASFSKAMTVSEQIETERQWREEFEAAARTPLEQRLRYAFIRTYKPVLDDAEFGAFDTMEQYREWLRIARKT